MERLMDLREGLQDYCCECIAQVYQNMHTYDGREWRSIKHLFHVLAAWDLLDREVTRLTEGE